MSIELTDAARSLVEKMDGYATNPDDEVTWLYELAQGSTHDARTDAFRAVMNRIAETGFPFTEFGFEIQNVFSDESFEFIDSIAANVSFVAFVSDTGDVTFAPDEDDERTNTIPIDTALLADTDA